ncbi:integrase core domain-containing protein [Streptomyces sp. NPDC059224]|uniref:integrase core domain-containing protein n=1 Tax=Streptomyces sp. NPDC059224 TaxID=3346775 RepID=UPI003686009B
MESRPRLHKTELIKPRKPWHGLADVGLATAEWVDWFNNQRLHTAIGDIPPTSTRPAPTLHTSPNRRLESTHRASTDP